MRLVIPACLAVTTLQLGCPSDTSPDGTSTTSGMPASTSTTDTSTSTSTTESADTSSETTRASSDSTTSTTTSTTSDTSGTESGSDTGTALPDCAMFEDTETCNAMPGCLWDVVVGQCDVDCTLILDMGDCVDQTGVCYWLDGACHHVAI